MLAEALDAIATEEDCGVGDGSVEALVGGAAEIEGEIELGGCAAGGDLLNLKAIEVAERGGRQLDQLQHHLHQRIATGVALEIEGLHHLLKGQLLVVVGRNGGGFDLVEELAEGEIG